MRILLVSSGSFYSTTEVHSGLAHGFAALGHDVAEFKTLGHSVGAYHTTAAIWRHTGREDPIPEWGQNWHTIENPAPYKPFLHECVVRTFQEVLVHAASWRADLVLFVSGINCPPDILEMIRYCHFPVGVIFTESPFGDRTQLPLVPVSDYSWTNERTSTEELESFYCPMAYHPEIHKPPCFRPKPVHDVVFVGVGYPERIALLEGVPWEKEGINLGLYGDWRNIGPEHPLAKFVHNGIISNADAITLYGASYIGLNLYRTVVDYFGGGTEESYEGESLNPRAYELAATRTFQVSQARAEASDVFGEAAVEFRTSGELHARLVEFLSDGVARERYADAQHAAVKSHSYVSRAQTILKDIGVD